MSAPVLHMICGKMAAGKSTLAARLAQAEGTVILSEDAWIAALFGDQVESGADFMRCSAKLRATLAPHVVGLLQAGVSVVLDFQANTVRSRAWMRGIAEEAGAAHRLHVLDLPDEVCLARLKARNAEGKHPFAATEAQFKEFTAYYTLPTENEGLEIVMHEVGGGAPPSP
ncbi:MAG: ATP-binding protein [Pseudomonadota bacterium]